MNMKIRIFFLIFFFCLVNFSALFAEEDFLEKGIAEYKDEGYEEAMDLLTKARKDRPDSSTVAYYLGLTSRKIGDYKGAVGYFKDALLIVPPVKDAYLELIGVLYDSKELEEAEKWIKKAEEEGVKPAEIAFFKGLVLLQKGDNEAAIESFTRARERDASLGQAADFQIAIAYAKERRYAEAKERLKAVVAIDPTTEFATFAEEYKKSIDKIEETHETWRFTVGMAYQFNDNVVLGPSTPLVSSAGDEITGEKDSGFIGTFRADFSPLLDGPWFFNGQLNIYGNLHLRINTHDIFMPTISLMPGYTFQKGSLSLPVSYSHILLNDTEYMRAVSIKPSWNMMFLPDHIGQFSIGYANSELLQSPPTIEENRNTDTYSLSAGYVHPFCEGKAMVNVGHELSFDDAVGDNWDSIGNRSSIGVLLPLMNKVSLMTSGNIFFQNFRNIHSFTGTGAPVGYPGRPEKRKDRVFTGSMVLKWEARKDINCNLEYSFTNADSNFPIYDYRQNMYTARIEYQF
jgi:tetratricopeptide (TPR) repeat protein